MHREVCSIDPEPGARLPKVLAYLDELLAETNGRIPTDKLMVIYQAWSVDENRQIREHIEAWRRERGLTGPFTTGAIF